MAIGTPYALGITLTELCIQGAEAAGVRVGGKRKLATVPQLAVAWQFAHPHGITLTELI